MNIVFLSKHNGQVGNLRLSRNKLILLAVISLIIPAALLYTGYHYGRTTLAENDPVSLALHAELNDQRDEVQGALKQAERNMNALSKQLSKVQARVIRLDALGRRLTKVAKLDKGEFDFDVEPAVGGPASNAELESVKVPDFMQQLEGLSRQLDSREEQLGVLESLMMNRKLQQAVRPSGRPISKGWTSSYYGMRNDPFTGKREHHKGVDFAGKEGSNVISVASGVITWASDRYGYGNMVEVNHGNGYKTRYGHNKQILVKVGDKVEKGDTLALMGSTGRSTGPHVHFEVLRNGRNVNPNKYISAR